MTNIWNNRRLRGVVKALRVISDIPGLITVCMAIAAAFAAVTIAMWRVMGRIPVVVLILLMLGLFFAIFALVLWISQRIGRRESPELPRQPDENVKEEGVAASASPLPGVTPLKN